MTVDSGQLTVLDEKTAFRRKYGKLLRNARYFIPAKRISSGTAGFHRGSDFTCLQANFTLSDGLHQVRVDLIGEFLGGVVAHAALAVVHGGHLQDDGQISARGDGDGV